MTAILKAVLRLAPLLLALVRFAARAQAGSRIGRTRSKRGELDHAERVRDASDARGRVVRNRSDERLHDDDGYRRD